MSRGWCHDNRLCSNSPMSPNLCIFNLIVCSFIFKSLSEPQILNALFLLLFLCRFYRTGCSEAHTYTQNEGVSHSHRDHEGPPGCCVWHHRGLRRDAGCLWSEKTCTINARYLISSIKTSGSCNTAALLTFICTGLVWSTSRGLNCSSQGQRRIEADVCDSQFSLEEVVPVFLISPGH